MSHKKAQVNAPASDERLRFTVGRDDFATALAFVVKALPSRPSVPVLAGVLFEGTDVGVTVSAFDYEQSRTYTLPGVACDSPGRALVGGKTLNDMVKKLSKKSSIVVMCVGDKLVLGCGKTTYTLPTMPVEDYPTLPAVPSAVGVIDGAVLAGALVPVAAAAGKDETLPMLTCVHVKADGDVLSLNATDRYRLHARDVAWSAKVKAFETLLPAKAAVDVVKAMTKAKGARVTIGHTGPAATVYAGLECGPLRWTFRPAEGGFPKARTLLPLTRVAYADVIAADLIGAVERVSTTLDKNQPVILAFGPGRVVVSAGSSDDAAGSDEVACEYVPAAGERAKAIEKAVKEAKRTHAKSPSDERAKAVKTAEQTTADAYDKAASDGLCVAANPAYLIDAIKTAGTKKVRAQFVDENRPFLVLGLDGDGEPVPGAWNLLMPIRLSDDARASVKLASAAAPAKAAVKAEEPAEQPADAAAEEPAEQPADDAPAEQLATPTPVVSAARVEPFDAKAASERAFLKFGSGDYAGALAEVEAAMAAAPNYTMIDRRKQSYGWERIRDGILAKMAEVAPADPAVEEPAVEEPAVEPAKAKVPAKAAKVPAKGKAGTVKAAKVPAADQAEPAEPAESDVAALLRAALAGKPDEVIQAAIEAAQAAAAGKVPSAPVHVDVEPDDDTDTDTDDGERAGVEWAELDMAAPQTVNGERHYVLPRGARVRAIAKALRSELAAAQRAKGGTVGFHVYGERRTDDSPARLRVEVVAPATIGQVESEVDAITADVLAESLAVPALA